MNWPRLVPVKALAALFVLAGAVSCSPLGYRAGVAPHLNCSWNVYSCDLPKADTDHVRNFCFHISSCSRLVRAPDRLFASDRQGGWLLKKAGSFSRVFNPVSFGGGILDFMKCEFARRIQLTLGGGHTKIHRTS